MDRYPLYLDKKRRIKHYILTIVILVIAIIQTAHSVLGCGFTYVVFLGDFMFYYGQLAAILVPGLLGFMPSMIFTLALFVFSMSTAFDYAYFNSGFLITVLLTYYFAKKKIFNTKIGFVFSFLVLSFSQGPFWHILTYLVVKDYQPVMLLQKWLSVMPETLFAMIVLYLLYNKAPDSIKELFFTSHFYTDYFQKNYGNTRYNNSRLVRRVNVIYILGTLIIVSSVIIIIFMTDNNYYNSVEQLNLESYTMDFHFLMRMIIMDINILIPMLSFFDYALQNSVILPVRNMSGFMLDYVNTDKDQRDEFTDSIELLKPVYDDEILDLYYSTKTLLEEINSYVISVKNEKKLMDDLAVAKAANEAKSAFLSNVSHEIRTPINAVLGMDEIIIRDTKEKETLKHALDIQNAGKILLALINDVLDFSKIEAKKMEIKPYEYKFSSLIKDLFNMISSKAWDKRLKLEFEIDENIPTVLYGDEIRINQCILNLLNNAIKYTQSGYVRLRIKYIVLGDDEIELNILVEDSGTGIKEEDLEKLFAPFERIDDALNKTIEGSGLGMTIVQSILKMMGSKLEVESHYGVGSKFMFKLKQKVIDWTPIGNVIENISSDTEYSHNYHELFKAPDARILVVDDTIINLTVVQELLKQTQIVIDTAQSGPDALEMVAATKYDILFIDHRMPGMDGIETLHEMKKMEDNKSINAPCIALTANAINGAKQQYLEAGFDDYVSKPVSGIQLEEMILRYLPEAIVERYVITDDYLNNGNLTCSLLENKISTLSGGLMDGAKAIENCGSEETLIKILKDFKLTIKEKSKQILKYAEDGNYKDYTVLVHALKSSSRLIGAVSVSEEAAYLEKCGDDLDIDEINKRTGSLIYKYRSLEGIIDLIIGNDGEDEKEEIPEENYKEALDGIYEFIESFDFGSADSIMDMLEKYKVPNEYEIQYNKLKELMANVDRDSILELLSKNVSVS